MLMVHSLSKLCLLDNMQHNKTQRFLVILDNHRFFGMNKKEQELIQFVNLSETLPRDGEKALDAAMGAAITMELPRQHQAMRSLGYFVGKERQGRNSNTGKCKFCIHILKTYNINKLC